MHRRRGATAAVSVLLAACACGCTSQPPMEASTRTLMAVGTSGASRLAPTAAAEPTPTLSEPAEEGEEPAPLASPVPDTASDEAAVTLAVAATTAFARPDLTAPAWWAQLSPMLSNNARRAYQGTDPANVPVREVTGPGKLAPAVSGYLATVAVPTDAGTFTVLLSRPGQNAPWAVERWDFPQGLH